MTTHPSLPTLVLAAALAACAAAAPAPPALSAAEYTGADTVETAARLLAIAAEPARNRQRHAAAVTALGDMAVRADAGEADVVGQWAAALPPDRRPPMRGRLLGPAYRSGLIAPGARVETGQVFEGGRMARVSISGEGQPPLLLHVSDNKARPVCKTAPGALLNCRWTPAFSGRYDIAIENKGDRQVRYFLVIG